MISVITTENTVMGRSPCQLILRRTDSSRNRLLKDPLAYLPAFDAALKEVVLAVHDATKHAYASDAEFYVGLRGSFGDHHVNPRTLRANMLGKMISVEGIVTRCTPPCYIIESNTNDMT